MKDKLLQPFIVKKIYAWLTFAMVLVALLSSATQGFSVLFHASDDLQDHLEEKSFHMPYKELAKEFVPRTELELSTGNMKEDIKEMKDDIKFIRQALTK